MLPDIPLLHVACPALSRSRATEGYQVWLARESGETSITSNCTGSGTNPMGPQTDVYYWELGPDAYGTETLTLKTGDMSPYAAYHRWDD